jgi:hypothetical protein
MTDEPTAHLFSGVSRVAEKFMGAPAWPAPEVMPGVAAAGRFAFDGSAVAVEKDLWPREKLVLRQKSSNLGDPCARRSALGAMSPRTRSASARASPTRTSTSLGASADPTAPTL